MNRLGLSALIALALLLPGALAFAQQDPDADAEEGVDLGEEGDLEEASDEGAVELKQDTQEGQSLEGTGAEEVDADAELESAKLLLGARYRVMVVPQFLINAFGVEGGNTVWVHGGGPEIGFAQDNFEILGSAWFAGYSLSDTPFKGPGDGPEAWEIINSQLSMAYLTADFLWKQKVAEQWDFLIGVGAGVGIVFGGFERWEAYWKNPGDMNVPPAPIPPQPLGDPYTGLARCVGPNNPLGTELPPLGDGQCPTGGNYGPAEAWPVYPWLTFQTGVRYEVVREFILRFDLGAGSSGFWFGFGADYGL